MARKPKGADVGVIFQERLAAAGVPQAHAAAIFEGVEDLLAAQAVGRGPTRTEFDAFKAEAALAAAQLTSEVRQILLEGQRAEQAFQARVETRLAEFRSENQAFQARIEAQLTEARRENQAFQARMEATQTAILEEIREMRKEIKELNDRVAVNEHKVQTQGWRLGSVAVACAVAATGVVLGFIQIMFGK